MSKIIVPLNKMEDIISYSNLVDGYMLGLEGLSIYFDNYFSLEALSKAIEEIHNDNKKVFIYINKLIHNSDVDKLKNTLIKIAELKHDLVLYDDLSIYYINEELNLKLNLCIAQSHLITSSMICNFWNKRGINYAFLSQELTLDELFSIKKNTRSKLIFQLYGFVPLFTTPRKLITNYSEFYKHNLSDKSYYLQNKLTKYKIYEDSIGTHIMSGKIINGIKEKNKLEDVLDYIFLNSYGHNDNFIDVIKSFKMVDKTNVDSCIKIIEDSVSCEFDTEFLYNKTVFKVKNNE